MGEEANDSDFGRLASAGAGEDGSEGDEGRVLEWEIGLPSADDLTPLSQSLIPPELASAFSITPEAPRTSLDVHRASQHTVSNLRRHPSSSFSSSALRSFNPFPSSSSAAAVDDPMVVEGDDPPGKDGAGDSSRKARRSDASTTATAAAAAAAAAMEEADSSAPRPDNSNDDHSARTLKRPRLVWTPPAPQEVCRCRRPSRHQERRAKDHHATHERGGADEGKRREPSPKVSPLSQEDAGAFERGAVVVRPSLCLNAGAAELARASGAGAHALCDAGDDPDAGIWHGSSPWAWKSGGDGAGQQPPEQWSLSWIRVTASLWSFRGAAQGLARW